MDGYTFPIQKENEVEGCWRKEAMHVFVKLEVVVVCVSCILNENKAGVIIIRQLLIALS